MREEAVSLLRAGGAILPQRELTRMVNEVSDEVVGSGLNRHFPVLVALNGGSLRDVPDIDVVWERIEARAGETFHLFRGGAFTYQVVAGHGILDRTPQQTPRSQFAKALEFVPLRGPGEIQRLRGPSFVYAILADLRIPAGEW